MAMKKTFSEYTNAAETNGADTPTNEQPTNQGANNMFTITSEVSKLITTSATKAKDAKDAEKKAVELIVAQGGRGYHFSAQGVKDKLITKETFRIIQGLVAKGLLSPAEFNLWAMDSKSAAAKGLQNDRNDLTSLVSSYVSSFRGKIETEWRTKNPELAKAEADAKKSESELSEEKSELPEAAPSAKVLTLELLHKFINDLTLEVSASKDAGIVSQRVKLIPALNALQDICITH
jgi:hypothetical protein